MQLHQFRHSPFCLKVRMALAAKGLKYQTVEVTPALGQVEIFKLSGQKQVPILVDGDNVLTDSSKIIRHLDTQSAQSKLIPDASQKAMQIHLIEDWADTTLAKACRSALLHAAASDSALRVALVPEGLPKRFRQLVGEVPLESLVSWSGFSKGAEHDALMMNLQKLSKHLEKHQSIVGSTLSLADIAIAAQISLLKFPVSSEPPLTGKGCPDFYNHPQLKSLFYWRDQLEQSLCD